jgi:CheY-like chemotaxis protein
MEKARKGGDPFVLVLTDECMPEMDGFALAERIRQTPNISGATIMMLTSADQHGDAALCRELGIARYLVKPVKQSELLRGVLKALNVPALADDQQLNAVDRMPVKCERQLDILLAEDNAVNQQVAIHILRKRGHSVVVACNGKKAIEALEQERFDVVLMDMQMPEMGGLEATAAIREEEKTTGQHILIVAMTAHAMKGDRERCLAGGMDDYVSKPVKASDLIAAVERAGKAADDPKTEAPTGNVVDMKAIMNRLDGDEALVKELAKLFLGDCPRLMSDVKDALAREDSGALEASAHALKGAAANFGAELAVRVAFALETIGREGNLSRANETYQALELQIQRLCSQLGAVDSMEEAA